MTIPHLVLDRATRARLDNDTSSVQPLNLLTFVSTIRRLAYHVRTGSTPRQVIGKLFGGRGQVGAIDKSPRKGRGR